MHRILLLSSHPLVDRILRHTSVLPALASEAEPIVWATSQQSAAKWRGARVEPFPQVNHLPEIPHNWVRRVNEYAWDYKLRDPSRLSMHRHAEKRGLSGRRTAFKWIGGALARAGLAKLLEHTVESGLIAYDRSPQATARLDQLRPSLVVSTGTFRFEEPAIVAAAKRLNIPVFGFITSWDNTSTKSRMVFRYNGFLVWSESMKEDLVRAYPYASHVPVHVIGAPHFDIFADSRFRQSRAEFCASNGIRGDLPYILYTLGVANGVEEHHEALEIARRVDRGDLGDVQLLVRPHPFQNRQQLQSCFSGFSERVRLQNTADPGMPRHLRQQDERQMISWVNSFRHAAVVVHLSSTTAIDAAIFDRPVVGLDYDPAPGALNQELVREVNHVWTHYKPVAESGGMWLVNNTAEMLDAIQAYLRDPGLHRAERRQMAEHVCGFVDGACGDRMAAAILSFAGIQSEAALCRA